MKKFLKWSYKTLRATFMTIVVTLVVAYGALYLIVSMPYFQNKIKAIGERELSEYLGTNVTIEGITISPFNQVVLTGVNIPDQSNGDLINVDKLGAGINLSDFIFKRKLVFTFAEVNGLHGHVTRPDKDSPTNLQFIIDKLKSKPGKPPKPYDIKIQHAILRNCDISYDVLNEPHKNPGVFDPNHLQATDLIADLSFPRIKNNDFIIDVERLTVNEKNGLQVKNVTGLFNITDKSASFSNLVIDLPGTHLTPADATFHYTSLGNAINEIKQQPITLDMTDNYVTLADFKTFAPKLAQYVDPVHFTVDAVATRDMIDVRNLKLNAQNGNIVLDLVGKFTNLRNPRVMDFDVRHIDLKASRTEIARLTHEFARLSPQAQAIVDKCGNVHLVGKAKGNLSNLTIDTKLDTDLGNVALNGSYATDGHTKRVKAHVSSGGFNLGRALSKEDLLGMIAMDVNVDASLLADKNVVGNINGKVDHIDLKGYRYHNIIADVDVDHNNYSGSVAINDPNGMVDLKGDFTLDGPNSSYDFDLIARNVNFAKLNLTNKYPANALNLDMTASVRGNNISNLAGNVRVDDVSFINSETGKGFHASNLMVDASESNGVKRLTIDTDFLHGNIEGQYDFASLVPAIKGMASKCFPQFMSGHMPPTTGNNNFSFNIAVDPNDEFENYISSYVKLPVKLAYKATIDGHFDEANKDLAVDVNMPYLIQGNRLIEGTKIHVAKDSNADNVTMTAQAILPSDKGNLSVNIDANAINDGIDANLNWVLNRPTDYHGNVSLSAQLGRDYDGKFMTQVDINPTEVVVNGTVWDVNEGHLEYRNGVIDVEEIKGSCADQFVKIAGKVSRDPDDMLTVALKDIRLDYIFETLKINHVTFGGSATGEFQLADLFSKSPRLSTESLHVKDLTYNGAHMGDGDIKSSFDVENTAVKLNCDLTQKNGLHTYINGEIFAASDSLYIEFIANKANVEFMKPFMEAFTEEVKGEVSGRAVLFGNFKTIDLYGDVYADDISLKIGYTNVTYHCSDSVHIEPGLIAFKDITIRDRDNHTAKLSGWLRHNAFHDPEFNFTVTDAHDLLVYDITPAMNPDWYGTIYGNGTAIIAGEPGEVRIGVNMETADNSKFTFVLSDAEVANEYNFITFRDRDKKDEPPVAVVDTVKSYVDELPEEVRQLLVLKTVNNEQQNEIPTRFTIDLQADITPEAEIVLVMDPVGGDRIRAFGSGNLRLNYNSIDDSFEMFGKYMLDKGSYNFTLQDIIIKDFTIRSGSTISFNGNPYNANLDINAVYSLNANLSDLDNSFSTDRDINRTNVPVNALLKVKGDIDEPELSFDLEFPTLTSDAYSKVKSVLSTDEMMSRQIIYLLALNRFYTPDYMQSTKNNNEFTSVASSTISSQLSSILGQISDNWQISPNFRSDKGDFSDVEVNLALSSQLLNNRLIFNGNFGYRDNTYNTRNSNFIGDFDLEYLLNRKGTIRLKAYNHFNDQNYYVRDAMTTQGVGVVFKHDFDRLFGKKQQPQPEATDTVAAPVATEPEDNLIRITPRKPEEPTDSISAQ
ncbi:MAG: translocation/assembly module TamB [Muribaculaceae bacterium]|nr:translocation/assembly module TamB [Muribaculaceae bacterium]